jgi:hypothetical protein
MRPQLRPRPGDTGVLGANARDKSSSVKNADYTKAV